MHHDGCEPTPKRLLPARPLPCAPQRPVRTAHATKAIPFSKERDIRRGGTVQQTFVGYAFDPSLRRTRRLGRRKSTEGRSLNSALVKCQSRGHKTGALPADTNSTCVEQHFFTELEVCQPAYLLALGSEVFRYLTKPEVKARHRLPVGKLWHPSWSNMKGGEAMYFEREIPRLRAEFQRARRNQ